MIINPHFYVANSTRDYPLDEAATCVDLNSTRLPSHFIVDMNLRYPLTAGQFPFIASVTVTANLVSVTIQAATSMTDTTSFVPVATFSMLKNLITPFKNYALSSQYPGAGGWIVFGNGINDDNPYSGRFAGPAAGLISPRAARAYSPLPVSSMATLYNSTPLTGIVQLVAESPLELFYEQHEVDDVLRNCVVLRLVQPANQTTSVFEQFIGPCGNRPESGNCGTADPIQFLNSVAPDCDGTITIVLRGCATIASVAQECGIVVDCSLGLSSVCVPSVSSLDVYTDACFSETSTSSESVSTSAISESASIVSESVSLYGSLPFLEEFVGGTAPYFVVTSGHFTFVSDFSPTEPGPYSTYSYSTETLISATQINISLWKSFDQYTVPRQYTTDVKLLTGGTEHNGGLVLNYRPSPDFSGQNVFHLIEFDYDLQIFQILFFNGSNYQPTGAFANLTNIQLNRWYRIDVTTAAGSGSSVVITATLTAQSGPTLSSTIVLTTNNFLPDTGWVGFHADRAYTRFSFLEVQVG